MSKYIKVSKDWLEELVVRAKKVELPVEVFNLEKVDTEQLMNLATLLGYIDSVPSVISLAEALDHE